MAFGIKALKVLACSLNIALFTSATLAAESPISPITATHVYLLDTTTGTVLYEKDADALMAPSSMTKIMTAAMIFEGIKKGKLSLKDTFPVSEKAWRTGGSKMFVELNSQVSVEDLLRGLIVVSGNDACVVISEGVSGDESTFAADMTSRAHELGAVNTTFKNASGLPEDGHLTTCKDLALIAQYMIANHPEFYSLFSEKEFTYNNIKQGNRNPLLYKNMGCDGLKTGHAEAAGFGMVASSIQPNRLNDQSPRRLILVMNGSTSMNTRSQDAEALMAWGFREFSSPRLFKPQEVVETADVWLGTADKVTLGVAQDFYVTLPRQQLKNMKVEFSYNSPLPAPLTQGQQVGLIKVTTAAGYHREVPLIVQSSVEQAGPFARLKAAFFHFISGSKV